MNRNEAPRLVVGDHCALLLGTSLYDVEVSEVRVSCEGDPQEFAMYRVKSLEPSWTWKRWFEEESQHRHDLFKMPSERPLLLDRLEFDIDALQYLQREQEHEQEIEEEAAIPHGPECECSDCQHERAADAAEEPIR